MRMRWLQGAVVGVVLGGVAAWGQTQPAAKRPMTFADLMAMKRVSDPQVSPSGKWVLFSVTDVSLEKNTKVNHLWVVPLAGSLGVPDTARPIDKVKAQEADRTRSAEIAEKQVTFGDGEGFGRFSPDGKWVSATVKDQVVKMPWDEAAGTVGAAVPVTDVAGGADGAVWSPDSQRLLVVASVYPGCSVTGGVENGQQQRRNAGVSPLRSAPVEMTASLASKGEAASWAEEDACDRARDEAAAKDPVKAQVWDGLLYRHWDHYTGEKRSHVLVVGVDGSGVRDLTPASVVGDAETPTFSLGGALGYAWAPDSKEIAYVTNLDAVKAASTNNDIFTLRLDEVGAKAVKVSTSPGSDDGPAYSPDGRWLAFRSQERAGYESDRFRLMVFDREKKTTRELMPKFDRWVDEFCWAPNSRTIYFAGGDAGQTVVAKVGVESGPAMPANDSGGVHVRPVEDFGALEVISTYRELSELAVTKDGGVLVASEMGVDEPTEISATDLAHLAYATTLGLPAAEQKEFTDRRSFSIARSLPESGGFHERTTITHINDAALEPLSLVPIGTFKFAGADGTPVQGFLIRPPTFDPAKKYPVKFLIHGGPQGAWGDSWSYRWNAELMAASGYVVVMVNPRGSTGYGQKFVEGVSGDWGGKAYTDLMRGLDAAEAKYPFIDKTRECALGASYGGYMANWILTHTKRFKCIVTHDGMFDPVSAYGATEEMWFNEWEFRRAEDFPGGKGPSGSNPTHRDATAMNGAPHAPEEGGRPTSQNADAGHPATPWRYAGLAAEQDPFRKWSPARFIQNAKTPTLVIHSQRDYRLDVSQGMALFTALQRLGVPSKMLYFPDEGHWVLKPKNAELWNATVSDWCDRWTKTGEYAVP